MVIFNKGKKRYTQHTDVRDGLFPALREALYQIYLRSESSEGRYRNSYKVIEPIAEKNRVSVDQIYDILIDYAWPRCKWPLIYGNGNFGFPPSPPRFTEVKPSAFYREIFQKNAETDTCKPILMPIPYALCAGTIDNKKSVTKIPPHNPDEVIDAAIALVRNPELTTKDLLKIIKGPSLLIGGKIVNTDDLQTIYESGSGTIIIRVTPDSFDNYRVYIDDDYDEGVKLYADWYGLKTRKSLRSEERTVYVRYNALLFDGETSKLMSLKEILQKYLLFYQSEISAQSGKPLTADELCESLMKYKKDASLYE